MIPTFLWTFFAPILAIIGSALSIVASFFRGLAPLWEGITTFIVWYVKTFFSGLAVVLSHLSTLTVIAAIVVGVGMFQHRVERKHLSTVAIQEVNKQKAIDKAICDKRVNDARKGIKPPAPKVVKKQTPPAKPKDDSFFPPAAKAPWWGGP